MIERNRKSGLEKEKERRERWLWRYRNALFKAESLWRQAEEFKISITKPSCKVLDGMPKAPGFSNKPLEKDIIKHFDLTQEAKEASARAKRIRTEIATEIDKLNNQKAIEILTLRYLEGMNWDSIRESINYSKSRTSNLYMTALLQLDI